MNLYGKIKVLIVSGILSSEHDYVTMNQYLRTMLEVTGRFDVKVTEEFNGATSKTLEKYDLVVLNYDGKLNLKSEYTRWNTEAEQVLFDFVKAGKGLVLHHSTVCLANEVKDIYRRINYLTMFVRGCEWAATGNVTLDKPDRSGERRFRKWPYYSD